MNEEITNWLNSNKDYLTGKELYDKYGKDATLKLLFRSGNNSFTRSKLIEALSALLSQNKTKYNQPSVKQLSVETTDKDDIPGVVKKWRERWIQCLKEMAELHALLKIAKTDKKRFELALKIDDLDIEADVLLDKINYFRDNGVVPDEEGFNVDAMTPAELAMARKNIPSYIAKINTKLKGQNITEERINELLAKKACWQQLLNRVINRINDF